MSDNKYLVMPCTHIDNEYESQDEVLVVELTKEMREALVALNEVSDAPLPLFGQPHLIRFDVPRHLARIYPTDITLYAESYDDLALITEFDPFAGSMKDVDDEQVWGKHTVQIENTFGYLHFLSFEEYGPTREYAAIPPAFFAGTQDTLSAEEIERIFHLESEEV